MQIPIRLTGLTIVILSALLASCSSISESDDITAGRYAAQPNHNPAVRAKSTAVATPTFSSQLTAVRAAANQYNPLSIAQDREFIGAILQHNGGYRYTVGQGMSGEDTVSVRIALPRGAKVVAFWHTHGAAGHARKYFSAVDTALVNSWKKPFYMADAAGVLRVFTPGDNTLTAMQAGQLSLGRQAGYAKGSKVIAEDGQRVRIATSQLARR